MLIRPLLVALVVPALIAGCSGDGKATSSPSAPSASASSDELPTIAEALRGMEQALRDAESVRIVADLVDDGERAAYDLRIKGNEGGRGTLTYAGTTFEVLRAGRDVYLRAPAQFFIDNFGAAPKEAEAVASRFMQSTVDNPDLKPFAEMASIDGIITQFFEAGDSEDVSGTVERTNLNGQPALALRDGPAVLYLADEAAPRPLKMEAPKDSTGLAGTITFSEYDAPVDLTAPTDTIDVEQFTA